MHDRRVQGANDRTLRSCSALVATRAALLAFDDELVGGGDALTAWARLLTDVTIIAARVHDLVDDSCQRSLRARKHLITDGDLLSFGAISASVFGAASHAGIFVDTTSRGDERLWMWSTWMHSLRALVDTAIKRSVYWAHGRASRMAGIATSQHKCLCSLVSVGPADFKRVADGEVPLVPLPHDAAKMQNHAASAAYLLSVLEAQRIQPLGQARTWSASAQGHAEVRAKKFISECNDAEYFIGVVDLHCCKECFADLGTLGQSGISLALYHGHLSSAKRPPQLSVVCAGETGWQVNVPTPAGSPYRKHYRTDPC